MNVILKVLLLLSLCLGLSCSFSTNKLISAIKDKNQLEISITDLSLANVIDVDVAFVSFNSNPQKLQYDSQRKVYFLKSIPKTSRFTINALHPDYEPIRQEIVSNQWPIRLELILQKEKKGIQHHQPSKVRNPFLIGVIPKHTVQGMHSKQIAFEQLMVSLDLERTDDLRIGNDLVIGIPSNVLYLFKKVDGSQFSKTNSLILQQLRNHPLVIAAGPLQNDNSVVGNQLIISFSRDKEKEVNKLLKELDLTLVGGEYGHSFIAEAVKGIGTELFEKTKVLKASGLFDFVQENSTANVLYWK